MLTNAEIAILVALPPEIELVGGPFCGVTLFTRQSLVSDVYAVLMGSKARGAGIDHWVPVTAREIHITRVPMSPDLPSEVCVYRPQGDGRWLYSGLDSGSVPVQA